MEIDDNNVLSLVISDVENYICQLDYERGDIIYRGSSNNYLEILRSVKRQCGLSWTSTSGRKKRDITKEMVAGRLSQV